jgi:hypothetical protein
MSVPSVMFGSSLPTEGTLMSYCTVICDVRFLFIYEGTVMSYYTLCRILFLR